jgi:hypothetical protein
VVGCLFFFWSLVECCLFGHPLTWPAPSEAYQEIVAYAIAQRPDDPLEFAARELEARAGVGSPVREKAQKVPKK